MPKTISQDDPCICGSGKKYKECCFSPEGLQNRAKSQFVIDELPIPHDVPTAQVMGEVIFNDGKKVVVDPKDETGLLTSFYRDGETDAEWEETFGKGVGKHVPLHCVHLEEPVADEDRDELRAPFEQVVAAAKLIIRGWEQSCDPHCVQDAMEHIEQVAETYGISADVFALMELGALNNMLHEMARQQFADSHTTN